MAGLPKRAGESVMREALVFAVVAALLALEPRIAARQAAPARPAAVSQADAFEQGLAAVRELVQRGAFDKADAQLKELLVWHEKEDCARLRQAEIVELA